MFLYMVNGFFLGFFCIIFVKSVEIWNFYMWILPLNLVASGKNYNIFQIYTVFINFIFFKWIYNKQINMWKALSIILMLVLWGRPDRLLQCWQTMKECSLIYLCKSLSGWFMLPDSLAELHTVCAFRYLFSFLYVQIWRNHRQKYSLNSSENPCCQEWSTFKLYVK